MVTAGRRLRVQLRHLLPSPLCRRQLLAATAAAVACAGGAGIKAATQAAALSRFQVVRIPGDGNCLFRAVAQGEATASRGKVLPPAQETSRSEALRMAAVQELVWRREEIEWAIEGDFDSYVAEMARSGTWAGEPELLMLSHHLQRPIEVYMPDPLRRVQAYGEDLKPAAICVLFHGSGHYEALVEESITRAKSQSML
mmetsp:Transcript_95240/g.269176  ORF Transcript_95240/g.269176 Transcript_95240/m.269176 type:complete len:198 (-) Transcript_95240:159-752(-)